ncbi:hypothetical protein HDU96_001004 [Phlyctochytrium bullatum]|nr:hypothetical protein HDU96_001004 [Phlyctochytrium bullatum]
MALLNNIEQFPLGEYAHVFMDWKVPVASGLTYFVAVKLINSAIIAANKKAKAAGVAPTKRWTDSSLFKAVVVLHNLGLCVFSAACFVGMGPRWLRNLFERPLHEAYCDRDSHVWNTGLYYWSWLFYLSKYYEIVDTIIILLKGRPSSLLQSYHHAGAIITMFLCVQSQATATWIFVVFNSFIHTIMYCYYALTTIGVRPPKQMKKMLTTMQISQFLIGKHALGPVAVLISFSSPNIKGGSLATSYVIIPGCMKLDKDLKNSEILAYTVTIGYLIPLTYLFVDFARKTYAEIYKRAEEKRKAAAAAAANGDASGRVEAHHRYPLRSRKNAAETEKLLN